MSKQRKMDVVELHLLRHRVQSLGSDLMKPVSRKSKCKEEIYKSKLLNWVMIGAIQHDLESRKLQQVID